MKIIGVIQILFGGFFLLNIASDIQFGFGLVLLTNGIKTIIEAREKF